jgi:hypothetical protein
MAATLIDRVPTPDEYRALCTAVGWADIIDFGAAPVSLARSICAVVAVDDGRTIGMGRVVAVAGSEPFYRRHGFERRDEMVGMFQVVRRGAG